MTDVFKEARQHESRPAAMAWATLRATWPQVREELAADRLIYLVAAVYVAAANTALLMITGRPALTYSLYAAVWTRVTIPAALIFVLVRTLPGVLRARSQHPLHLLLSRAAEFATPRAVAGLALIVLQVVLMGTFTSMKTVLPQLSDYVWDTRLAHVDAALFGGHDPWTFITPVFSRLGLLSAVEFFYSTGWLLCLFLVPATVALVPTARPIRVRFFITYILSWALLGNLLALLGMSAGPVYFGEVTGDFARYQPLVRLLAADSGTAWSAYDIQQALWQVYERGMTSLGTGISAFPSLHVAMVTLWTAAGFHWSRTFGAMGLALLAFFQTASVALGWHYAIDGLASMILVVLIWTIVGRMLARLGPAGEVPVSERAPA